MSTKLTLGQQLLSIAIGDVDADAISQLGWTSVDEYVQPSLFDDVEDQWGISILDENGKRLVLAEFSFDPLAHKFTFIDDDREQLFRSTAERFFPNQPDSVLALVTWIDSANEQE
jgi:hypothetical protein